MTVLADIFMIIFAQRFVVVLGSLLYLIIAYMTLMFIGSFFTKEL